MAQPESGIPQLEDKRPKITGLLPRNAQARVLLGVAGLMILVMIFSGHKEPSHRAPGTAVAQTAIDPNQARIEEYRSQIEAQARQLSLEEAQLAHTKETLGFKSAEEGGRVRHSGSPPPAMREYDPAPEKSWIELDREKREYQGLYSSNVALSYRRSEIEAEERVPAPAPASAAIADAATPKQPAYRLVEGTILETVLTNRLDSSFSGPVNCMVTTNVYSPDHQVLLIPQGSRVLGEVRKLETYGEQRLAEVRKLETDGEQRLAEVRKLETYGEQRLAVTFHRIIRPDGSSVNLDQFKGLSQIGETGLRDQVNHHYFQIFGVSLAIGAIAGLAQADTRYGFDQSGASAYEQGVTNSLSQSSLHILDRYLNVLPTFTIREGQRVKIYLSQDLTLLAYSRQPE